MRLFNITKSSSSFLLFIFISYGCMNTNSEEVLVVDDQKNDPLFNIIPSSYSGIDFQNTLTEGLNTNVLMYEYFYNGGGVASGDLNGDGLIDLYFTSNMANNKMYLNKGDMHFEDITTVSKASGRPGPWKTGVTMVDINGDNRLDLYISYSGMLPEAKRVNQLFINQGNNKSNIPIFKEEAQAYGLASAAFSNQIYFFDYDKDGDLDALLLNHNPKSLPVLNEVKTEQFLKKDDSQRGIRLYKQEKGFFTDITTTAKISGSALSYGLGIGITDANNDGWSDFYVSNDYAVPDYLYINNQDGTFTNSLKESIAHNSHFSMGNDIADINNDGLQDIITLDMLPEDNHRQKLLLAPDNYAKFDLNIRSGFHYQYMRNMLQLNNGNGTYAEIGQLSGISNTDWSWAALLADYNNDGWKDLYVTNGYFRDYTNLDFINYMEDFVSKKGRLERTDVLEIINHMPSSNVPNYMFMNQGYLTFKNAATSWGIHDIANSNGAAYADLDNDGDLDLIVNNINQDAFIYRNESRQISDNHSLQVKLKGAGQNTQGIGAKVSIFHNGKTQTLQQSITRGYLSSISPILHFGLGKLDTIDSLHVVWTSGKMQVLEAIKSDQLISLIEKNATIPNKALDKNPAPIYEETSTSVQTPSTNSNINDFDRQSLLISELSYSGPCMTKGDLTGDGLEDIFIGGIAGQSAKVFIQQKNGRFTDQPTAAFELDKNAEDADAVIFDANNDGYADIYVASGGYHHFKANDVLLQDRLYINNGKGDFSKDTEALPSMMVSKGCVAASDINSDGFIDLFVGGRVIPGRYPETPVSYLLINDGTGKFSDQIKSLAPELQYAGMVTDAAWLDINGDNQQDLLVVGEWMPVMILINTNSKLKNETLSYLDQSYSGWWNTIEVNDFNNDTKPDFVLGNMGTNTQFQVSHSEPAEMYFNDFDNNGSVDPIFCYYIQGKSYPYVTRDELLRQLANLRSKYTTYKSFADETIDHIFDEDELNEAKHLEANHMETSIFISNEQGQYDKISLPIQVQYSPVYTITSLDYNQDGNMDLILCGNNSHAKLRLGKFDANYGLLLKNDGTGEFEYIKNSQSGLKLSGDVRSAALINNTLFFGLNQAGIVSYELNTAK